MPGLTARREDLPALARVLLSTSTIDLDNSWTRGQMAGSRWRACIAFPPLQQRHEIEARRRDAGTLVLLVRRRRGRLRLANLAHAVRGGKNEFAGELRAHDERDSHDSFNDEIGVVLLALFSLRA